MKTKDIICLCLVLLLIYIVLKPGPLIEPYIGEDIVDTIINTWQDWTGDTSDKSDYNVPEVDTSIPLIYHSQIKRIFENLDKGKNMVLSKSNFNNFGLSGEEINIIFNNKNKLTYKKYNKLIIDLLPPAVGADVIEEGFVPKEKKNEGIAKYSPNTITTFMYIWLGKGKTSINREDFKSSVIDATPYEHSDILLLIPEDNFLELFDLLNGDKNDVLTVNEFKNTKIHKENLKGIANKYINIFYAIPGASRILQGGKISKDELIEDIESMINEAYVFFEADEVSILEAVTKIYLHEQEEQERREEHAREKREMREQKATEYLPPFKEGIPVRAPMEGIDDTHAKTVALLEACESFSHTCDSPDECQMFEDTLDILKGIKKKNQEAERDIPLSGEEEESIEKVKRIVSENPRLEEHLIKFGPVGSCGNELLDQVPFTILHTTESCDFIENLNINTNTECPDLLRECMLAEPHNVRKTDCCFNFLSENYPDCHAEHQREYDGENNLCSFWCTSRDCTNKNDGIDCNKPTINNICIDDWKCKDCNCFDITDRKPPFDIMVDIERQRILSNGVAEEVQQLMLEDEINGVDHRTFSCNIDQEECYRYEESEGGLYDPEYIYAHTGLEHNIFAKIKVHQKSSIKLVNIQVPEYITIGETSFYVFEINGNELNIIDEHTQPIVEYVSNITVQLEPGEYLFSINTDKIWWLRHEGGNNFYKYREIYDDEPSTAFWPSLQPQPPQPTEPVGEPLVR